MSVVYPLHSAVGAPATPGRSHWRLRWTSRALAALFTLLLAADALITGAMLLAFAIPFAGQHLGLGARGGWISLGDGPLPHGYLAVSGLPLAQRLAHIPVGLLHAAPVLLIFWSLRQLFALYGQGLVFGQHNARHLKRIGACLVIHAAAPLAGVLFLRAIHMVIDQTWMHGYSLQELVLGGIVYVIAQVMQVGREIEEERSQFV